MQKIKVSSWKDPPNGVRIWHVSHGQGILTMHFYAPSWEEAMKMAGNWAALLRAGKMT